METMISERLEELRSVTPSGAASLFNDFETVCRKYYERGETFKQALYDAYIGQMFDVFMTDFRCGWNDISRLQVPSGLMTVSICSSLLLHDVNSSTRAATIVRNLLVFIIHLF